LHLLRDVMRIMSFSHRGFVVCSQLLIMIRVTVNGCNIRDGRISMFLTITVESHAVLTIIGKKHNLFCEWRKVYILWRTNFCIGSWMTNFSGLKIIWKKLKNLSSQNIDNLSYINIYKNIYSCGLRRVQKTMQFSPPENKK
jgi:hypothetical protein